MKLPLLLILSVLAVCSNTRTCNADLIITSQTGTIYETDGITTFGTTGEEMVGMTVAVTFADSTTEEVTWVATGAGTGGAFGTGWDITLGPGTSWSNPFMIQNINSGSAITDVTMHGAPASVIFDRTFGGLEGTITSARGKDIQESGTNVRFSQDIIATYFDTIRFIDTEPVGDLFAGMHLNFELGLASGNSFGFVTDTDTGSANLTVATPEPSSCLMLAMFGVVTGMRRKRRGVNLDDPT